MAFWRRQADDDVEAVLRKVGKRDGFRWLRRLDETELARLAENVRSELVTCDSRDELLEHAARLHYQTQPRIEGRLERGEDDVVDEEAARGRALALIFERRYGESLEHALNTGMSMDTEAEEASLRIEKVLRQLGLAYTVVDQGHWVFELDVASVHVRHYIAAGSLDVYAPVRQWEGEDDPEALLRQNGGSVAGAFWGVCTFESAGDHLCACARVSTADLQPSAVSFALASVASLVDAATRDDA